MLFGREEPWQIQLARYCVNKEGGFTSDEARSFAESIGISHGHFEQFFTEEILRPSGTHFNRRAIETWMAPMSLVSKVTEFDELKEARSNAFWAQVFSILSLIVACVAVLVQIFNSSI